ncbi:MAG: hypothetical protein J2P54_25285 [Bradyrhizobiaceae bacterium]|nr:hypothetical protein [Bradyrhizobiaceae bacterium]
MLRRFAPHIVVACLVLASLGVWAWKIMSMQKIMLQSYVDPRAAKSCAELLSLYSARPTVQTISTSSDKSRALSTTMRMCDYSVQFYDAEEALIRRVEAPDNPCVRIGDSVNRLKDTHGRMLIDRIGSCHAAAINPGVPDVKGGTRGFSVMVDARGEPQTPISEVQPCEELRASLVQDVPPERAFQAFKTQPTRKNHCDFVLEISGTEQAIISRFESAGLHCGVLDRLKTQHAETLETQTKVCEAATVDPDGLVTQP